MRLGPSGLVHSFPVLSETTMYELLTVRIELGERAFVVWPISGL
jgi:hypothetical protein